jgi:hypothetical protein
LWKNYILPVIIVQQTSKDLFLLCLPYDNCGKNQTVYFKRCVRCDCAASYVLHVSRAQFEQVHLIQPVWSRTSNAFHASHRTHRRARFHLGHGVRHEPSSPARTLGSWIRISLEAWMSVCVYSVFVLFCVQVATLRRVDPPSREYYRLCMGLRNWKAAKTPTKGCGTLDGWILCINSTSTYPNYDTCFRHHLATSHLCHIWHCLGIRIVPHWICRRKLFVLYSLSMAYA